MCALVAPARRSLTRRTRRWLTRGYLPAAFLIWTALVGLRALTTVDTKVARFWDQHNTRGLDHLAAAGSPLFGIVGAGLLAGVLGLFLLWRRRPYLVVALVLALMISGLAERGLRAAIIQPSDRTVRQAAYIRAQSDVPLSVQAIEAVRASIPALALPDPDHSYPSGHATLAGALVLIAGVSLRPRTRRLRAFCAVALTLLFVYGAWSEVYRGTHLFSDTIGGLLLGCLIASLCVWIARRCERLATGSLDSTLDCQGRCPGGHRPPARGGQAARDR